MAPKQSAVPATDWPDALPQNSTLNDYNVDRVLGRGGFGIVYLARHVELQRRVAIKEYLPADCALRHGTSVHTKGGDCRTAFKEGLNRFRDEARRLVELDAHPAVVSCHDFFRANGTAYLVMEYAEGQPLSEVLKAREAAGRPFDEPDLLNVMTPLLEGLQKVHDAGIIHRDIKPSNIMIRKKDGKPVLLDFGAAKQGVAELTKSMAPHTPGYAAVEQVGDGKLGPWTDIYAIGAVMWRMVAGGNPPCDSLHPLRAEHRMLAQYGGGDDPLPAASVLGAGRFSAGVLEVIEACLQLRGADRPKGCLHLSTTFIVQKVLDLQDDEGATSKCRKAADQGHAWAQYSLGKMYAEGGGMSVDAEESQEWYRKAADQGHANAQYEMGEAIYEEGHTDYVDEEWDEAEEWYRKAADQGHALAQYSLGKMYYDDACDHDEAAEWYRMAADQGHALAQYSLGKMCYDDFDDYDEAAEWYRKAANQGVAGAQLDLGNMCADGEGVSQDEEEAAEWYRKAADQGEVDAQYRLGTMYYHGRGVSEDKEEAAAWYRKAADKAYCNAQNALGNMYAKGEGVSQDYGEALAWYRKAADQGMAAAEFSVGEIYYYGRGVLEDDVAAAAWCRKAAGQGHAVAQYTLGDIYRYGRGVPVDLEEAAMWFRKAADQGDEDAQSELDDLEIELDELEMEDE